MFVTGHQPSSDVFPLNRGKTFSVGENITAQTNPAWRGCVSGKKRFLPKSVSGILILSLRVKRCDLAQILVADPSVSSSKMTKINCPLELEGS